MTSVSTDFKVLLRIPIAVQSGYGNDGLGITRALLRWGADVYLEPTHVAAPLPPDVAALLTKPVQGPFDLTILHVDPAVLAVSDPVRLNSKVVVGWTMWEYGSLDNLAGGLQAPWSEDRRAETLDLISEMKAKKETDITTALRRVETTLRGDDQGDLERMLRKNLADFDVIVGYDYNTTEAFAPYFDGPRITVQGGFWPEDWPEMEREWDTREFYFFMIGVLSERKDPFVTIGAFRDARDQDPEFRRWARLSLKTTAPGLHNQMEDLFREPDPETGEEYTSLRIFYDIWTPEVIREFYSVQHVLVAPSRGEGKNMPALEFMSTGGTVIATNWGGHTGWMNPDYAYPLDYTLAPSSVEYPTALNARADQEHLTRLMLHCFHNRAEVRGKGELAAQIIPGMCSWDVVMERFLLRVSESLGADGGVELWNTASSVRRVTKRADS